MPITEDRINQAKLSPVKTLVSKGVERLRKHISKKPQDAIEHLVKLRANAEPFQ